MIIYDIAGAIYRYSASHYGRSPSRVRAPRSEMDTMNDELRKMTLYPREDAGLDFRIAGVEVVQDDSLAEWEIDD